MNVSELNSPPWAWINRHVFRSRSTPLKVLRVVFLGWSDIRKRDGRADGRGNGDVDFYAQEIAAGRESPGFPKGLISIDTGTWPPATSGSADMGTPSGAELLIVFSPDYITATQVLAYVRAIGIDVSV